MYKIRLQKFGHILGQSYSLNSLPSYLLVHCFSLRQLWFRTSRPSSGQRIHYRTNLLRLSRRPSSHLKRQLGVNEIATFPPRLRPVVPVHLSHLPSHPFHHIPQHLAMLPPRCLLAWIIVLHRIGLVVSLVLDVSLDWLLGRMWWMFVWVAAWRGWWPSWYVGRMRAWGAVVGFHWGSVWRGFMCHRGLGVALPTWYIVLRCSTSEEYLSVRNREILRSCRRL